MESQTHYIKADPGYSVIHLTFVPGYPPLTEVIPVIAWQIMHTLIEDEVSEPPLVTVNPIVAFGTVDDRNMLGPVVYPDGRVQWDNELFDSVDDWTTHFRENYGKKEQPA